MSKTIGKAVREDKAAKFAKRGTDPDNGNVGTDPDAMSSVTPDPVEEMPPVVDGSNDEVNLGPGDVPSRVSEVIPEAVQGYQAWRPEKPDDMSDEDWRKRAFPDAEPIPEPYGAHTLINRPEGVVEDQLNAPATIAPSTFVAAIEVPGPNSKADPAEVINPRTEFDVTPESYIVAAPVATEKGLEATKALEKGEIAPPPSALPPKEFPLTPPEANKPSMTGTDTTTEETAQTSNDPALVHVKTAEEEARLADPHARQADAIKEGLPAGPAVDGQQLAQPTSEFEPAAVRTVREMEAKKAPIEPGDKPAPKAKAKAVSKGATKSSRAKK